MKPGTAKVVNSTKTYTSGAQQARVQTESWLAARGYCPACSSGLRQTTNNTAVLDFTCSRCDSGFELKSRKGPFGASITDGAYSAMVGAIRRDEQPNLFLLSYRLPFSVTTLSVLPRRFLVEPIVVKRKPLSRTARRAGWVGCNLNLSLVPKSALIACLTAGVAVPRATVVEAWKRTAVLDELAPRERGWLAVTLGIVDRLRNKDRFTLDDVYAHEATLARLFPNNRHIRPKLRQQLQILRDMGLVAFLGRGSYALRLGSDAGAGRGAG